MWSVNSKLLKLLRVSFISKYGFHPEYEQSANSLQNVIYLLSLKSPFLYKIWQYNKMKPHSNEMFDCVQSHEKPAEPRGQGFRVGWGWV